MEQGESTSVEFKRNGSIPGVDVFETICSFSNRYGGNIFLGVLDDGTIEGVNPKTVNDIQLNIVNVANNPNVFEPLPIAETEVIRIDTKQVIRIWVPMNTSVIKYKGKIYDRVFDVDKRIRGQQQISQLYIRKQNYYSEQSIYPGLKFEDLRPDLIERARKMANVRRSGHPWASMTDRELLRSARLYNRNAEDGTSGYNLAAALLLGSDSAIASVAPAYRTDALVRRINVDRYDDRLIVKQPLIEAYDELSSFAKRQLPDSFNLEGTQSISPRDIIIRELVTNTLIHREFSSPIPGKLIIDDDGIHTENASKSFFEGRLNLSDFNPMPKNPIIADFFTEIGLADELGSGMRNLNKYSQIYSGQEPVLSDGDIFEAFVPVNFVMSPKARPSTNHNNPESQGTSAVLQKLLQSKNTFTAHDLAHQAGVTDRTARRNIAKFIDQGLIEALGKGNARKYQAKQTRN